MYCSNCGNKVEDGRKECPYCGAGLGQILAGAGAPVQSGAADPVYQQAPLPQSQQELKEYLERLARVESDPALASAMPHLPESGTSTEAVVRYYGAAWISKHLYQFLQPGERVLALSHIQKRLRLRGVRTFLTVTDRRIFRVDRYHIFTKARMKGVNLSQITSIEADSEKNWAYAAFVGEKVRIHAADSVLKLRMTGCGAAQWLKRNLTEYLSSTGASQRVEPYPGMSGTAYTDTAYAVPGAAPKTKKSKKGIIIGIAAGVLVIGGAAAYVVGPELIKENQIEEIKGGTYSQVDITVGEAFDDFFGNCTWETKETRRKGTSLVQVSGRCYYQDADTMRTPCKVTVQFLNDADSEQFGLDTITVNGEKLNDDEMERFMEDVLINRGQIAAGHYSGYNTELPDDAALAFSETEAVEAAMPETAAVYETAPETMPETAPADAYSYSADPVVSGWEQELAYIQDMSGIDRSQYVLEWSSESYVEFSQLDGMSYDIARLAVNEIYARHGRRFQDEHLQAYFDSKPWYYGGIAPDQFNEGVLSEMEKGNIQTIRQYMEEVKGQ